MAQQQTKDSDERRWYPRYQLDGIGAIEFKLSESADLTPAQELHELNISLGGAAGCAYGVRNSRYLEVLRSGRLCRVRLPMPDGDMLITQGRIVWLDFNNREDPTVLKMGLEFFRTTPEQRGRIETCLRLLRATEKPPLFKDPHAPHSAGERNSAPEEPDAGAADGSAEAKAAGASRGPA